MDLEQRTLEGLDWPVLVQAWSQCARTTLGAEAIASMRPLRDPGGVRAAWDAVDELRTLEDSGVVVPVGDVQDIRSPLGRAERGQVLEGPALLQAGRTLRALVHLERVLHRHAENAPVLATIASIIHIDAEVVDELNRAFDPTGQLSSTTFPRLGELRRGIQSLHEEIRHTLDRYVRGEELGDLLQDRYWTQRENRYVLPIKAHARRWDLGIVHGASGSGQTVFIEPHAVIQLNNRLRVAEAELTAEEHRILTALSARLGTVVGPAREALEAATLIDLAAAREGFARRLGAVRPHTGDTGTIRLKGARHPVLVLRGVPVVANDLALDRSAPVLVISGPNAGGKTVALKTIGLCVLLVQYGCFVPADEDSRVDLFDQVLASIGDQQTVEEDLSSFSGHLVNLREMLERAEDRTLMLLDEIASGTDPAQGAALAQAVLEELADKGPRVVVTTHFARLKGLAAADPRFAVAAMQYAEGRPTYRVLLGATGESHAFSIAAEMGLPDRVLSRAASLLGEGDGELTRILEDLERERSELERRRDELGRLRLDLEAQRTRLAEREEAIKQRAKELEHRGAEAFLARLAQAEKAVGQVVADLQRAPDPRRVQAAKATLDTMRGLVPARPAPDVEPPTTLAVGDRVRLRDLGREGEVVAVGNGTVQVRTGGITVKTRPEALERLGGRAPAPKPGPTHVTVEYSPRDRKLEEAVRIASNTLDLRGKRVDEGLEEAERFFDRMVRRGVDVVFVLHGHGTGALKQGMRDWLATSPYVASWAPAAEDQGGDAFTVVQLQG